MIFQHDDAQEYYESLQETISLLKADKVCTGFYVVYLHSYKLFIFL